MNLRQHTLALVGAGSLALAAVSSLAAKVNGKEVKNDVERTGNGFRTDRRIEANDTVMPTTCKMQRPL